ncbi:hypothetical protein EDF56_106356 [Novosphingobium sp. PhB165]|uniref:hypothetical protein n=1 Tax=Novosphingobium sp. PhB165 TaxID=2485105 RepID=UPI00104A0642|nr:hypothetical protein [Novosphingobium sp. PhB165]TCM17240.1 hypothetical protein EDF56_106356 [Novosphingobium sp. PhB165]
MKGRLIITMLMAAGSSGYLALDHWIGTITDSNAAVRDFALTPAFTVTVILGALAAAMLAFAWLAYVLFPRPTGRTASGEGE